MLLYLYKNKENGPGIIVTFSYINKILNILKIDLF